MYRYSIHDIVQIESVFELPFLSYFSTKDSLFSSDLQIETQEFDRKKSTIGEVGDRYMWDEDNGLHVNWGKIGRGWPNARAEIEDLPDQAELRINQEFKRWGDVENLVLSIIVYKMWCKNATMIHAAGVVDQNNQGTVIHGFSNMGKSSTSIDLCTSNEYDLLGDDTVIIQNNRIYPFARKIGVSPGTIIPSSKLNTRQKIQNTIHGVLEQFPIEAIPFLPALRMEIDPSDITTIANPTSLKYVVFLEPERKGENFSRISSNEAQRRAAMHSYFDGDGATGKLHHLIQKYIYFDERIRSDILDKHRQIILDFFEKCNAYEITSSKTMYSNNVRKIVEIDE